MGLGPYRVDVHHHFVPPVYRSALDRAGVSTIGGTPFPAWDEDSMWRTMDKLAIKKAYLSVSAPGVGPLRRADWSGAARACNEAAAETRATEPERVGILATLPLPDVEAAVAEIRHCADELAVDGFILLSNADGMYLSDQRMAPVLDELNRRKAVAFIHPAIPPGVESVQLYLPPPVLEFTFDTTRVLADLIVRGVLDRYPDIRFVAAHLGGALPFLAWRLSMLETDVRGVYQEFRSRGRTISSYLNQMWFDTAMSSGPASLAATLSIVGPDRLVFGSDVPFAPTGFLERCVDSLEHSLDAEQRRAIETDNAERLFASTDRA